MIPQAFSDVWDLAEGAVNSEEELRVVRTPGTQRVMQSRKLDHRPLRAFDMQLNVNRGELARLDELVQNTRNAKPFALYPKGENALAWSLDLVKGTATGIASYGWLAENGEISIPGGISSPFGSASPHLLRGDAEAMGTPRITQQMGPFAGGPRTWHFKAWVKHLYSEFDKLELLIEPSGHTLTVLIQWASGVPTVVSSSSGVTASTNSEAPVSGWYPIELVLDPRAVASWTSSPGGFASIISARYSGSADPSAGEFDTDNLIPSPHDFSTGWVGTATVTSDNGEGPFFGLTDADKIEALSGGQLLTDSIPSMIDGDDYSFSVYLKAGSAAKAAVIIGEAASSTMFTYAELDFGTGVAILKNGIGPGVHNVYLEDLSVTSPGSPAGWYRLGVDCTNNNAFTGGTLWAQVIPAGLGGPTGSIYAWGARFDHENSLGVGMPNPYPWRGNAVHGLSAGVGQGQLAAAYRECRGESRAPAAVTFAADSFSSEPISAVQFRVRVRLEEEPI